MRAQSHGAMITRAPAGGSSPTPSMEVPTYPSQRSSCSESVSLSPLYQEFA